MIYVYSLYACDSHIHIGINRLMASQRIQLYTYINIGFLKIHTYMIFKHANGSVLMFMLIMECVRLQAVDNLLSVDSSFKNPICSVLVHM